MNETQTNPRSAKPFKNSNFAPQRQENGRFYSAFSPDFRPNANFPPSHPKVLQ
jgi:hypothetical protein